MRGDLILRVNLTLSMCNIRYLRKKIDDDFDVKLIQTVRGIGYMLTEPD